MAGVRSFGISRDQDLHLRALQLSFDQLKRHSGLGLQFEFICSLDFACRSPDKEKLQRLHDGQFNSMMLSIIIKPACDSKHPPNYTHASS